MKKIGVKSMEIGFLVLILILFTLVGCGRNTGTEKSSIRNDEEGREYLTSSDELEDGCFYILRQGRYYPLYTMESMPDGRLYEPDYGNFPETVCFPEDSFGRIPVLTEEDRLVCFQTGVIDESFRFRRYRDLGTTVGILYLRKTESGRYVFDAVKGGSLVERSDAEKLSVLSCEAVVLESIGGSLLREGNITEAGTIAGLERGACYQAEIYTGSVLKKTLLSADVRVLSEMERAENSSYVYLPEGVVSVSLPGYFHSGFYSVNGSGIFCLLKDESSAENTDFNQENIPSENTEEIPGFQSFTAERTDEIKETFVVRRTGDVLILVREKENGMLPGSACTVLLESGGRVLYTGKSTEGECRKAVFLYPGRYELKIRAADPERYEYLVRMMEKT